MSVRLQADILFRLMLSECETVRELLGVDTAAAARENITTDAEENLPLPRIIVVEGDYITQDVDVDFDAESRPISAEFEVYIPEAAGATTRTDEKKWLLEKMDAVHEELWALRGTGEPLPGVTHLWLTDPTFHQPLRQGYDERLDEDTDPSEGLPLWLYELKYELV